MKNKQNMIEMFKGYIDYSNNEYKDIWQNAMIVVDSNILLNFYRYSEDTRNKIFEILEKLKTRLWIPYQVGKEFFDNKNKVMVNSYNEYDNLMSSLVKKLQEAKDETNKRKNNQLKCKKDINEILDKSIEEIGKLLNDEKVNKKPKFSNDDIEKKIIKLFNNAIGEKISGSEYEKMKNEGLRRFKELIPPGYKDNAKEENGDYYIFYSIIKKTKEVNKDVIFITDDVKEDWFNEINGEKHGGRYELLNEFYKETGRLLIMYTSDGFAEAYNKNLDKDFADENTIKELKSVRTVDSAHYDRDFFDEVNNFRMNGDNVSDKETLKRRIIFKVRQMNLTSIERMKVYNDLSCMENDNYFDLEMESESLKNIAANSTLSTDDRLFIINRHFVKRYDDRLRNLKICKSKLLRCWLYKTLQIDLDEHLNYLLYYDNNQTVRLIDSARKLFSQVSISIEKSAFYNISSVIENLEAIIADLKMLISVTV